MAMVISGAKRGEVADAFFMDENYRKGSVILLKGNTPVSEQGGGELTRSHSENP